MRQRRRTALEQAVFDALRAFPQFEIREQIRIGRYRVDFLIGRLVVECNGEWTHSSAMDRWRDACRTQKLRDWGYEVVCLTEQEIRSLSPLGLIDHLDKILRRYEHCCFLPTRH
jgi:very-short-patch-repair endonuclease